jgi:hypothetical protein
MYISFSVDHSHNANACDTDATTLPIILPGVGSNRVRKRKEDP